MSARLFERNGIWFCWVPKPGGGTRKVTTNCTDRKAAEKRAAELEREAVDPSYAAANKATTSDACDRYLTSRKARGRADGTLHFYGVKLGHIVRLMPARLADIDASACEAFIATRMAEGAKQTTVKKEIRALGSALRHAGRLGLYARNIDTVIPELEDTYEPRTRFLLPLELVALLGALPVERAAHLVFIVATGARWGESVRACSVDVDGHMVHMRGTKTKRSRGTVPVPPTMRIALAWALANANRSGPTLRLCAPNETAPPLFASWGNVRRDLAVACARIGIAPVTPNDLRRTFATWLRMSGVTTDLIGAALRHTTSRMAEICYGRIKPEDLDRLISERGPALMIEEKKESEVLGLLMGGQGVTSGPAEASPDTSDAAETPCISGARGRNRTADTGIFNPPGTAVSVGESENSETERAANGLTFRARARRWFARVAA